MQDYENITGGLNIPSQIPLNIKEYCINESSLSYLGFDNSLAFTYIDGIKIFCQEERTLWEWREVQSGEENTGLVPLDFTYPPMQPVFNVDYSNKTYNFFKLEYAVLDNIKEIVCLDGTMDIVETNTQIQLSSINNITGSGTTTVTEPTPNNFIVSSTDTIITLQDGNTTDVVGNGTSIPYSIEVLNLQKVITSDYTLQSIDNHHTIIIDTKSSDVIITIPTGLIANISVNFTQTGTNTTTFIASGTTINSPIGLKIKGDNYWANIYKRADASETFQLAGALKL